MIYKYDFLIIGAGVAGMSYALRLRSLEQPALAETLRHVSHVRFTAVLQQTVPVWRLETTRTLRAINGRICSIRFVLHLAETSLQPLSIQTTGLRWQLFARAL